MAATSYAKALDTYLQAYGNLKEDLKTLVQEKYGVSLGTDFLQYGQKISQIQGTVPDVIKQAMYVVSADSGLFASDGTALKSLSKPASISSDFVTDLELSSFEKFKYWFLDPRTEISFPNLSTIHYGDSITAEQREYIEEKLHFSNNP